MKPALSVAAFLAAVLLTAACSRNSFKEKDPKPVAPKNSKIAKPWVEGEVAEAPQPPPERPSPGKAWKISGTVLLPDDFKAAFTPGEALFIIARNGVGDSTPVAARKISAHSFPVRFELTEKDSMTGEELPEKLFIEAKLDSDGDVSTKSADDLWSRPVEAADGGSVTLKLEGTR